MVKQVNLGLNNQNTNIKIEQGKIIIAANTEFKCTISELWECLINQFDAADKKINNSISGNVLITKTQTAEPYDSSKIISSLVKIGIPLPASLEIAEKTLIEIEEWISKNKNSEVRLTTKVIRQIVSLAIENLDIHEWNRTNIETWNIKYIRRYGHNNKTVQICNIPPEIHSRETENISYDFVMNVLLNDIILSLTSNTDIFSEISNQNRRAMAEEVIDFINNCDLYMIKYDVLKSIILELATQLPHPWLISTEKREKNIYYDRKSVVGNLSTAKECLCNDKPLQSNLIVEILHHASSMVLEKYFSFLGCYDLTAFYRLEEIIRKITYSDSAQWDTLVSDYAFKDMLDDCTMAGVELQFYQEKISRIHSCLDSNSLKGRDFTQLIIDFAEISLQLQKYGNKREIKAFLENSWEKYSNYIICENIKTVLLLIYPYKNRRRKNENESLHFWLVYSKCFSSIYSEMKPRIFVLVANHEGIFDYSVLSNLCQVQKNLVCNTIFLIAEKIDDYDMISKQIIEKLKFFGLDQKFMPIILCKNDLTELFYSSDRIKCFDSIIDREILPIE